MSFARLRRLPITPGAALFVVLMALAFLGAVTGILDLHPYLTLRPAAVWRGEVWRLVTYPLFPMGPLDLLMGGWAVLWLGAWLEREWSALECWLYGGVGTTAAGALACLLFPRVDASLGGSAIVVAGLLAAWFRLCGHRRVLVAPEWETSVRSVALAWGAVLAVFAWFSCGRWFALPMLAASAAAGWAYLSLRWLRLDRAAHRPISSRRGRHLEL